MSLTFELELESVQLNSLQMVISLKSCGANIQICPHIRPIVVHEPLNIGR